MFKKVKKLSAVVLSLGLVGGFFLPNDSVSAKSWDCELTIDANKHSENKGVYSYAKGECWLDIYGYFSEVNNEFTIEPSGFSVHDGQIIEIDFGNVVKVNTIQKSTTKPDPKPEKPSNPENKPETKPEKPSKSENKPNPKPEKPSNPENKPETKPEKPSKSENKPNPKPEKPSKPENKPETKPEKPNKPNESEGKPSNNTGASTGDVSDEGTGVSVKGDVKKDVKSDKKKENKKDGAVAKGKDDKSKDASVDKNKNKDEQRVKQSAERAENVKNVVEEEKGEKLPNTATSLYNLVLGGVA